MVTSEILHRFFTKVNPLFKNGQKKCPKSKTQNTFVQKPLPFLPFLCLLGILKTSLKYNTIYALNIIEYIFQRIQQVVPIDQVALRLVGVDWRIFLLLSGRCRGAGGISHFEHGFIEVLRLQGKIF